MLVYKYPHILELILFSCTFAILYIVLKSLKGVWTCFLANFLGFGVTWKPGPTSYAIITGATDGIGLEYSKQLAQMGYSLLIISRNEEKLHKVAQAIKISSNKCNKVCV